MLRWMSALALCVAIGCSTGSTETSAQKTSPSLETFAGAWRSVTPSMEFIRLSIVSKSSEQGALAARLTFSGVYWEGSGRVEGDSLVLNMLYAGQAATTAVFVARPDGGKLALHGRPFSANALELSFVRED
jgi:hypothetical protein